MTMAALLAACCDCIGRVADFCCVNGDLLMLMLGAFESIVKMYDLCHNSNHCHFVSSINTSSDSSSLGLPHLPNHLLAVRLIHLVVHMHGRARLHLIPRHPIVLLQHSPVRRAPLARLLPPRVAVEQIERVGAAVEVLVDALLHYGVLRGVHRGKRVRDGAVGGDVAGVKVEGRRGGVRLDDSGGGRQLVEVVERVEAAAVLVDLRRHMRTTGSGRR